MASFFKHQPKFRKKAVGPSTKATNHDPTQTDNKFGFKNPHTPSPSPETDDEDDDDDEDEDDIHCFCHKPDSGKILGCENDECKSEWFHPKCLGIVKMPAEDEAWICPDCREGAKMKKMIEELEDGKGSLNGLKKVNLDGVKIVKAVQKKGVVKVRS